MSAGGTTTNGEAEGGEAFGCLTEGQVDLSDGRRLGFAEFGCPTGAPLFYFHGCPGSRLEAGLAAPLARRMNVRLIALDRPGCGLSGHQAMRVIADWPSDVEAVVDRLGLERYAILGVSGGAPYAAACALAGTKRLTRVGIASGLGPLEAPGATSGMLVFIRFALSMPRWGPLLVGPACGATSALIRRNAERFLSRASINLAPPDVTVLGRVDVRRALAASFRECVRQGRAGLVRELQLYGHPWGLDFRRHASEVLIFHGEQDRITPPAMACWLAEMLPGARTRFYPGEGHHSLPINRADEIFRALLA